MMAVLRRCLLLICVFPSFVPSDSSRPSASIAGLENEIQALQAALDQIKSDAPYMVINTVRNRLQIRQKDRILQESICATGSGKVLIDPHSSTTWSFETPRGVRTIQRKVTDPIWAKPVWAFVEQGKTAPILPWEFDRLDPSTLGKYALQLGDGYEIHGTLYPSLLGKHITHGCIRLDDEALESAYRLTRPGHRVYIF